eukprot:CAMPEP_0179110192 /NCGR_PEP_ID=MMETSP0796-20121207/51417_1 /TAXON_ID=73915 /ORGANISM="Pyrodinium bahamense, Strain pbaha01" /LENGTH=220 /DNA_ID=CAMNT_0020808323 /DNA_START=83 /DNA_END=745 /DNA_ORIENTATION=-
MTTVGFNPEAPAFTPLSEHKMRADAAEFIPMFGDLATLQKAVEAHQQKQKRQMPPATDEEWETRIAKREKEVVTIKALQSYRLYVEVFPHDKRSDDDPKTPDPRDKTVSKRMWKWNVEKWRLQLKSRCVYSRAVTLQCREYILRQERMEARELGDAVGQGGGKHGGKEDQGTFAMGALRAEPAEKCPGQRLPNAAEIPQPPGIAIGNRAEPAQSGASKFQ